MPRETFESPKIAFQKSFRELVGGSALLIEHPGDSLKEANYLSVRQITKSRATKL
jgi:hypothetical protein